MGRPQPPRRGGKVIRHRAGERWTAEVLLEEGKGAERREVIISIARNFTSEDAAERAGGEIVAQWKRNAILRDVLLRELAATYRALRESHAPMDPPSVPTTRASWERAIATWEERGWIAAADAIRYREHVATGFAVTTNVRRCHLPDDADTAV
jgi:hypothetical protein